MTAKLATWLKSHVPTREQLEKNRFIKPFAHHILRSDLWRFNRRSVPRGVALGLFVGIMIPLAHFVVALFLAVFVRANIPAAMMATFIGFPAIYVFIAAAAYQLGKLALHVDALTGVAPITETMQQTQTDHLLQRITGAGLETAFGLFIIATITSAVGYLVTSFFWSRYSMRRRRTRLANAAGKPPLP